MIFDPPGVDPGYSTSNFTQPNQFGRLKHNNGIRGNPPRTEYYPKASSRRPDNFDVTLQWTGPNDTFEISERFYTPVQRLCAVDKLHRKGFIGTGVKVMCIDEDNDKGYSNSNTHSAIGSIYYSDSPSKTYLHPAQVLGTMACKPTGNSKLIGNCYGSTFYSKRLTNFYDDVNFATVNGIKIIIVPAFLGELIQDQITAVSNFYKSGGLIVASSGNGGTLDVMQPLCGLPGVVSVGCTRGGTVDVFEEAWHSRKISPVNGKTLDFALPALTTGVYHGLGTGDLVLDGAGPDCYGLISNTSFAGPQVGGILACLMQRSPDLSERPDNYVNMLKENSYSVVIEGVTCRFPNCNFIR